MNKSLVGQLVASIISMDDYMIGIITADHTKQEGPRSCDIWWFYSCRPQEDHNALYKKTNYYFSAVKSFIQEFVELKTRL